MACRLDGDKPLTEPMPNIDNCTLRINFSEILIKIHIFSFKKMPLKMSSEKWRPSCLGLNQLTNLYVLAVFEYWFCALQWRHNGRDSVSNHQPHDYLLNRLFRRRTKKTSKLRVTGLCAGNSPGSGEFPLTNGQLRGKCFRLMTSSWVL